MLTQNLATNRSALSNMVVALQGVTPPPFTLPTRHRRSEKLDMSDVRGAGLEHRA